MVALCRRPGGLASLQHPDLRIAAGDLRDPAFYTPLLRPGISVFHLAGARNQPRVQVREMEEVNVEATLTLARRAAESGAGRFVHAATALIYGPSNGEVLSEQDDLDSCTSAYARSKAEAVRGIRQLAREGLPAVIVCPTIVFGPDHPSHPNRVTSEIRRLLRGGLRGGRGSGWREDGRSGTWSSWTT